MISLRLFTTRTSLSYIIYSDYEIITFLERPPGNNDNPWKHAKKLSALNGRRKF